MDVSEFNLYISPVWYQIFYSSLYTISYNIFPI